MNLRSSSKEEPEINLTSLIDVVLLLLVFFMVSTSFVREAEISLRLPQAQTEVDVVAPAVDVLPPPHAQHACHAQCGAAPSARQ